MFYALHFKLFTVDIIRQTCKQKLLGVLSNFYEYKAFLK